MKLFDARTPNSMRVHVLMAEKGIDLPREPIDVINGGTRTGAFLKINSLGELPVLKLDDGRYLAESIAICRYLEALHPEPSLFGTSPEEQAWIEMWNRRMELHVFNAIGYAAQHTLPFFADKLEQIPAYADAQVRRAQKLWTWLDAELADGRPYIAGDRFSVADITGLAALMVSALMDAEIPRDATHAINWQERVQSRPSVLAQQAQAASANAGARS